LSEPFNDRLALVKRGSIRIRIGVAVDVLALRSLGTRSHIQTPGGSS